MAQKQVIEEPNPEREQLSFEDLFSLRKPRDARAGLASGLKSMGAIVLKLLDNALGGPPPQVPRLASAGPRHHARQQQRRSLRLHCRVQRQRFYEHRSAEDRNLCREVRFCCGAGKGVAAGAAALIAAPTLGAMESGAAGFAKGAAAGSPPAQSASPARPNPKKRLRSGPFPNTGPNLASEPLSIPAEVHTHHTITGVHVSQLAFLRPESVVIFGDLILFT